MSSGPRFDRQMLIEYGASLMYYIEKHKLLDVMSRLLAEIAVSPVDDVRKWLGENLPRIARAFYMQALEAFHRGEQATFYQLPKSYLPRIVIFGKLGAGRHSLAGALVKRFNLVYIDADVLLYHKINTPDQDELSRQLQSALELDSVYAKSQIAGEIIQKRLLMADALQRGWVLLNYPNNSCEARELFESFTVPPNRFVYLKCPERMARARVVTTPFRSNPQNNFEYIDRQMQQYRRSKSALNEYLANRREVVYIDASPCFEAVKVKLLAELSRTPYMLGFKFAT